MITQEKFNEMFEQLIDIRASKNLKQSNESINTIHMVNGKQIRTNVPGST